MKAAHHDADSIADPLASQFFTGERGLTSSIGLIRIWHPLNISVVNGVVGHRACQFCFNRCAIFTQDPVEAVDFFVDFLLDLCELSMHVGHVVDACFPRGRGNPIVGGLVLLTVGFG